MPNKSYQRGSNFERQVQTKLEKLGYYAMRSAGSHTVVDVIGIKEDSIVLIQCKTSNTEVLPDIKQLFKSFESDGTKTNIKLLEELEVPELWNNYNQDLPIQTEKLVIWKGKGRNNIWMFRFVFGSWMRCSESQLFNSINKENNESQESQII